MDFPMLSLLILVPVGAAAVVMLLPKERTELHLPVALVLSLLPVGLGGVLFARFESIVGFQFVEQAPLIERWGVSWHLGIDGIALPLIILTTILIPISIAASTSISKDAQLFLAMVLLLEAGLIGVFSALDLIVFFVFFEAILIPMYFIIGIWGSENRIYAAIKFFLYTAFGSALMLVGIIALSVMQQTKTGVSSFDYNLLLGLEIPPATQAWLFVVFGIAFAIKVPMFPFHTWLPDAHVQAPTAGSVLLAGVMLKLGTYGFLRFNLPLFPDAAVRFAPVVATLAVIGIVYGAAVAIVQTDLKKLVAYSSVSHLGFIMLGIVALTQNGLDGGVIQMVNHGVTTGALFLLVGMLYERRHTKLIADFGGLQKTMPIFAGVFLFSTFASIGLPGLNGFVGEFLVLIGSYATLPGFAVIATAGVVLAAVYLLWAYERVFTGAADKPQNQDIPDLNLREILIFVPLIALILVLGVYPKVLLDRIEPSTAGIIDRIEATTDYVEPTFVIGEPSE
jgi:NADH-quinone oxidoreductase subunit M